MSKLLWRSVAATGVAAGGAGGLVAMGTGTPVAMAASNAAIPTVATVPGLAGTAALSTGLGDVTPSILSNIAGFVSNAGAAAVGALVAGRWIGPPAAK